MNESLKTALLGVYLIFHEEGGSILPVLKLVGFCNWLYLFCFCFFEMEAGGKLSYLSEKTKSKEFFSSYT